HLLSGVQAQPGGDGGAGGLGGGDGGAADGAALVLVGAAGHGLVPCEPCGGTGHREEYAAIHGGQCFPCGGTGRVIGDADDDQEHDG
ncbi:hypothetical protein ACFCWE_36135, partial [Streptomyces parvus]